MLPILTSCGHFRSISGLKLPVQAVKGGEKSLGFSGKDVAIADLIVIGTLLHNKASLENMGLVVPLSKKCGCNYVLKAFAYDAYPKNIL